jgi:hypothetical protein
MSRHRTLSLSDEKEKLKRDDATLWLDMREREIRERKRKRPWSGPSPQWLIDVLTEILVAHGYPGARK